MTMKIKACPHCGGTDHHTVRCVVYRIICERCGTHTNKGKMDEVTINWNERRVVKDE